MLSNLWITICEIECTHESCVGVFCFCVCVAFFFCWLTSAYCAEETYRCWRQWMGFLANAMQWDISINSLKAPFNAFTLSAWLTTYFLHFSIRKQQFIAFLFVIFFVFCFLFRMCLCTFVSDSLYAIEKYNTILPYLGNRLGLHTREMLSFRSLLKRWIIQNSAILSCRHRFLWLLMLSRIFDLTLCWFISYSVLWSVPFLSSTMRLLVDVQYM